jgi:hypothetical protein
MYMQELHFMFEATQVKWDEEDRKPLKVEVWRGEGGQQWR